MMITLLKVAFYSLIFLAHVYTVYHIQYNAGFMEETILAFTVGFMNSSEYQTYLNYLFDVFYCTLIALYFFSRWSSKEVESEPETNSTTTTTITAIDPEAPKGLTKVNRVTEQQPVQQPQQQQQQQKTTPQQQQQQQKGPSGSPKAREAQSNNKNNDNNSHKSKKGNNNSVKYNKNNPKNWAEKTTTPKAPKRGASKKDSISLENGTDFDDPTSGAICGVTGSVAAGDMTFSFANITFFDVFCISFVFPLCLLAIYLGWNMQTSVEISWLSWRWLWGWWTERWTWWRLAGCLLAVVGITVWVKPTKVLGKTE